MLLGQIPGDGMSPSTPMFAVLPSYATLVGQYLNRFGPYRLQPYAPPPPVAVAPKVPAAVIPAGQPPVPAPLFLAPKFREARGDARRNSIRAVNPIGAGPGVLTGYDRVIGILDRVANPTASGIGFSNPTGAGLAALGLRELAEMSRRGVIDKIDTARRQGIINDANVKVRQGTPTGRAGGVGTAGVGGGFTRDNGSNRGPGSRGRGFDHFGGPR